MGYNPGAGLPKRSIRGHGIANGTRPTVLSVDDEPGILDSICLELEDDFDVVTAASGWEALDLLSQRHVDAILLDLRMPEMEGQEVLKRLRAVRSRSPVIVMTVLRETKTVVECMKLGASDYVTKPWESGELTATIRRILREVETAPGVLLVSDDPAALVPVKLALEAHVRVMTMSVAAALVSNFPALVMVHASHGSRSSATSGLLARFPRAAVVWVSDDLSGSPVGGGTLVPPHRLDLTLSHVSAALGPHAAPRRHLSRAVMAAVDLMVSHCQDPLTIDEIAGKVGVSEDHLTRVFREAFGLPAATYYARLRIAVACRLLRDTDEKIDGVAHQVGYSSAANLSRAFKEVMSVRPGEFRRSSA